MSGRELSFFRFMGRRFGGWRELEISDVGPRAKLFSISGSEIWRLEELERSDVGPRAKLFIVGYGIDIGEIHKWSRDLYRSEVGQRIKLFLILDLERSGETWKARMSGREPSFFCLDRRSGGGREMERSDVGLNPYSMSMNLIHTQ